ncbi:glycoside hydrolase family 31 protein [Pedococcus aerophilus]|uniref:Glycoside hydrolase family 31 protein n=1 Tax=Pedococcus aerophilus TaxID=436356 RepID=A0ABN3UEJ2_9MICO
MLQTDHFIRFEKVGTVTGTDRGLLAEVESEQLRVDLVSDDVVRVKMSRGGVFDESPTFAVCVDPMAGPVEFALARDEERVTLTTSAMVVSLWLAPFRLDVHRTDGSAVVETAADEQGRYWAYATLNDTFTVRRRCRQEDAVFGLGEKSGRHNRKGRDFTMWNTDVLSPDAAGEFTAGKAEGDPRGDRTSVEFDPFYVTIPFFYHQTYPAGSMAASFMDNGYRGEYEFSAHDEYRVTFRGGQWTEYIFAGPDMPQILTRYTALTGRTQLPPLWSLGYHQCRWFDYTEDAVEALGRRHRDDEIPCDALWLDIDYMDGYRVFTWDTEKFPDAPGMLERLSDQGFKVITIIDPGVKWDPGYAVFDEGVERDVFCRTAGGDTYIGQVWPGNTAFPDFVTEEAREWWGGLNAKHVQSGIAGIWNDMNEPATGSIAPDGMRFGRGEFAHERYRNQYALLMAMGTTQGLQDAMPELRTFILSRAGFAGIQRYAANWMGDNLSRWDHLWLSIAMGSGFGVSGQAFVGADVGGFAGSSDPELFTRWMQYGVLTPFCRNHSMIGNVDQYAWAFGPVVEDIVRDAIRLRYRLMPYIYSAFVRASLTGEPVQRPMVFDHQYDGTVRDIDDQYLFGTDLLVAPVTEAGTTSRQVHLPDGDWYDWHSAELHRGRSFVVASTPMDRIPVYARGGAVIPMWETAPASTDGFHPDAIELHVFVPHSDGAHTSRLVEDDGLTTASVDGAAWRTTFTLTRSGSQVTVAAQVEGDGYPQFRREVFHLVVHGAQPTAVDLGDVSVAPGPQAGGATFVLPVAAEDFTATFHV